MSSARHFHPAQTPRSTDYRFQGQSGRSYLIGALCGLKNLNRVGIASRSLRNIIIVQSVFEVSTLWDVLHDLTCRIIKSSQLATWVRDQYIYRVSTYNIQSTDIVGSVSYHSSRRKFG